MKIATTTIVLVLTAMRLCVSSARDAAKSDDDMPTMVRDKHHEALGLRESEMEMVRDVQSVTLKAFEDYAVSAARSIENFGSVECPVQQPCPVQECVCTCNSSDSLTAERILRSFESVRSRPFFDEVMAYMWKILNDRDCMSEKKGSRRRCLSRFLSAVLKVDATVFSRRPVADSSDVRDGAVRKALTTCKYHMAGQALQETVSTFKAHTKHANKKEIRVEVDGVPDAPFSPSPRALE